LGVGIWNRELGVGSWGLNWAAGMGFDRHRDRDWEWGVPGGPVAIIIIIAVVVVVII